MRKEAGTLLLGVVNPLILAGAGQDVTRLFCFVLPISSLGLLLTSVCRPSASKYSSFILYSHFVSFGVAVAHLSPGVKGIPLSVAVGRVVPSATIVACGGLRRDPYPQQCGYTNAANGCGSVF